MRTYYFCDMTELSEPQRKNATEIILQSLSDYYTVLVKTEQNFCDFDIVTKLQTIDNRIVLGIQIDTYRTILDILRTMWNIPSYGFKPLFGSNKEDIRDLLRCVVYGLKKYPKLNTVNSRKYFSEFEQLTKKGV